ncbi:MAG: hypothetical protein IJ387_01130, partial [Thermoguttaceae bacterium]|nr:hypothetical protein [Thermoguttaceae bacterium]
MPFSPPFASVFRRKRGVRRRRAASSLAVLFFAASPLFAFAQPGSPTPPSPDAPKAAPPPKSAAKPAPKRPASFDWALDVAKFLTSSPQKPAPPTPPNAPRPDAPPRPPKPPRTTPKTFPRPVDAAFIGRTPSLNRLEDDLATFFQQTSGVPFRPLAAMRATPFGGAVEALDLDAPAGFFLFFDDESPRARAVFVLPVDDFAKFVSSLGGDAKRPDANGCVSIKRPVDA